MMIASTDVLMTSKTWTFNGCPDIQMKKSTAETTFDSEEQVVDDETHIPCSLTVFFICVPYAL